MVVAAALSAAVAAALSVLSKYEIVPVFYAGALFCLTKSGAEEYFNGPNSHYRT